MICYKDKTFCNSDCINKNCHRFISEKVEADALEWSKTIGLEYPLMACSDFSEDCYDYYNSKCEECGEMTNDGVGEMCCTYGPECETCSGRICDQSC